MREAACPGQRGLLLWRCTRWQDKTKHNMGEFSHGRAWESKLEEEERRQEQAGKGCDGETGRVTRRQARGVGYWGVLEIVLSLPAQFRTVA